MSRNRAAEAPAAPAAAPPAAPKADPLKAAVASRAVDRLRQAFPDQIEDVAYHAGEPLVRLRKEKFPEIARFLRDDPERGVRARVLGRARESLAHDRPHPGVFAVD